MDQAPANFSDLLAQFNALKQDIAFARALRNLRAITANGDIPIKFEPDSGNVTLDLRALTPTSTAPATVLPSQTGHGGSLLTTDGATLSWV